MQLRTSTPPSPAPDGASVPVRGRTPGRRPAAGVLGLAAVVTAAVLPTGIAQAKAPTAPPVAAQPDLGPNVVVFDPSMPQAQIQAEVDAIYAQQVDNEMGTQRYALMFKPGTYGSQANPLDVRVGYYTEVDGLGQDPGAVTINGGVTATGRAGSGALDTFWRSVSNLTIHAVATPGDECHTASEMWAVSQAAPMRRVDVKDFTT